MEKDLAALLPDFLNSLLSFGFINIRDSNFCAFACQCGSRRLANAHCATGHDGDFVLNPPHDCLPLPSLEFRIAFFHEGANAFLTIVRLVEPEQYLLFQ